MKRLKKERLKRDWTQTDLAERVDSTKQAVCNWEKGRSIPRHHVLIKLENLFQLSHQKLLAEDYDETPFF